MNLSLILNQEEGKTTTHKVLGFEDNHSHLLFLPIKMFLYRPSELKVSYVLHSAQHKAVDLSFLCKHLM